MISSFSTLTGYHFESVKADATQTQYLISHKVV